MARPIQVTLNLGPIPLERIKRAYFDKLRSDIKFLSQQSSIEIHECYKNKKIDFGRGGRSIEVETDGKSSGLLFIVEDSAGVEGNVSYFNNVGSKEYTQKKVDELRARVENRDYIESN